MCKAKRFWVTTRKLLSGQSYKVAHMALVAVAVYKILTHDHGTKILPWIEEGSQSSTTTRGAIGNRGLL